MEHGRRPVRAVHAKKSICWSRIELLHAGPEDTWLYEVLGFLQRGLTFFSNAHSFDSKAGFACESTVLVRLWDGTEPPGSKNQPLKAA